jgi:hypothetical protein
MHINCKYSEKPINEHQCTHKPLSIRSIGGIQNTSIINWVEISYLQKPN